MCWCWWGWWCWQGVGWLWCSFQDAIPYPIYFYLPYPDEANQAFRPHTPKALIVHWLPAERRQDHVSSRYADLETDEWRMSSSSEAREGRSTSERNSVAKDF
ncbi:hypothetical protein KC338_g74 [Hortaea werneckii]|nr:hypothetical protein KC338_g74 [Hortaea werneckii]